MKKTYIKPSMEEVKLHTPALLAGSLKDVSEETPSEWGAREDEFDWLDS